MAQVTETERKMIEQQGGLTVSTWEPILQVVDEYRQHRSLDPSTMIVIVLLRSGEQIPVTGIRAAITWTVLLTEDDEMRIVPNREIAGIHVGHRAAPAPARQPAGFTFERVDEEATTAH